MTGIRHLIDVITMPQPCAVHVQTCGRRRVQGDRTNHPCSIGWPSHAVVPCRRKPAWDQLKTRSTHGRLLPFSTPPETSVTLRCQGFVAATTTLTSFETNGRGLLCLGQLCDPTLIATKSHAPTASHGEVGSVTVNPRAMHTTKECNAKKGHNHSIQENHASLGRTHLSIQ